MKRLISLIILLQCLSCSSLYGQYGLETSLIAPTGYYSYILKPTVCFALFGKTGDPDKYYSFGASFGYSSFSPTQDTFRTYAVGGATTQLLPGYEVLHSYQELSVGVTNDFRILPDSKLCPYIGLDIYFYAISISEDYYAETLINSSEQGDNYWLLSILPRVGIQYKLSDKFYLSGGMGKSISFTGTVNQQEFWKTFISITYNPD